MLNLIVITFLVSNLHACRWCQLSIPACMHGFSLLFNWQHTYYQAYCRPKITFALAGIQNSTPFLRVMGGQTIAMPNRSLLYDRSDHDSGRRARESGQVKITAPRKLINNMLVFQKKKVETYNKSIDRPSPIDEGRADDGSIQCPLSLVY